MNAPENNPTDQVTEKKVEEPKLEIVIYPDPFLRLKTAPFTEEQLNSSLVKTIADLMIEKMYELKGVGLAANQVGVPNSIFVMDHQWHASGKKKPQVFLNPYFIHVDESEGIEIPHPGEGCLSLPYGYRQPVPRPHMVQLGYKDLNNVFQAEWYESAEAIVVQHEMDHLDGHLFVDRLSRLKQDIFTRKVKKIRRRYKKGFKTAIKEFKKVEYKKVKHEDLSGS